MASIDFDSSDIELPEAPANPHAHRGAKSIKVMKQTAFEDRIESKIQSKMLVQRAGAPGTIAFEQIWKNRFNAFREHTLHVDLSTTPTGAQLERFFLAFPKSIGGKTRRPVAWTWMVRAYKSLDITLTFEYPEFELKRRDHIRFQSVLVQLQEQRLITKDATREKQWLGAAIVKQIIHGLLVDALDNGTHSWDVTCSKALSIVLQAACCARAGDIAVSPKYSDEYCLKWDDIRLKFIQRDDGSKQWVARLCLDHEKGHKDDKSQSRYVRLESLSEPDFHVVCPVKWLLIMALRTSAVAQTTIQDLERVVANSWNRTVVWKTPGRPVLSAFKQQGCMLDLERPARIAQLCKSLKAGCELIGMTIDPVPHDLRRGAARDIAHLPQPLRGASDIDSARFLGHTPGVRDAGITRKYIGDPMEDSWKKRLEADLQDDFAPEISVVPFKRVRQSTEAVKRTCEELGLDPNRRREREQARYIGRSRKREQWIIGATDLPHKNTVTKDIPDAINDSSSRALASYVSNPAFSLSQNSTSTSPQIFNSRLLTHESTDSSFEAMSALMSGNFADGDLDRASDVLNSLSIDATTPLLIQAIQDEHKFVTFFSRRNDYRNEVAGNAKPVGQITGGSRDPPSRWVYSCINAPACSKMFQTRHLRDSHGGNCDPTPRPVLEFVCDLCETASFDTQNGLNIHIKHVHGVWIPMACDERGCDSTEIFQVRSAYTMHRQNFHSDWYARVCPVPFCTENRVFQERNAFIRHLESKHPWQKKEFWPAKSKTHKRDSRPETLDWKASRCLYPGCASLYNYTTRDSYVQHLRIMHKVYAKDNAQYMPSNDVDDE